MSDTKKRILLIVFLAVFISVSLFNFSNASNGKQSAIDSLVKQLLKIKEKLLEIQKQLLALIKNTQTTKKKTLEKNKKYYLRVSGVSDGELNITPIGVSSNDEYLEKFMQSLSNIGFTNDEFDAMKKDKNGRPYSLEELAQQAVFGANLKKLKSSFAAWQNLDERSVEELKKLAVNSRAAPFHRTMVAWYKYHAKFAEKLQDESLSKTELNDLYNQHQKNIKTYAPKFQQLSKKSNTDDDFFSFNLIPKASAAAETKFYHFGGLVLSWADVCTTGVAIVVGPPRGGLLWIYYAVWTANPYLYKNLSPGANVLGRALWGPGICNKGIITYPIGMAQILYFGSSPL